MSEMLLACIVGVVMAAMLAAGLGVGFTVGTIYGGVVWRNARGDAHEEFKVIAGETMYQPTCDDPDCEVCRGKVIAEDDDDEFDPESWKRK